MRINELMETADLPLKRLATFLCDRRDEITKEWTDMARQAVGHAQNLTFEQLADHMPELFDDLADLLQSPDAEEIRQRIRGHAKAHGRHRWKEGYELPELLRELALVRRLLLLKYLQSFAAENPDFDGPTEISAREIIHDFFEETVTDSVEQFVEYQQRKIHHFNEELKTANQDLYDANQRLAALDKSRLLLTKTVSHELGNILNIQSGAVTLLKQESEESIRRNTFSILRNNIADMSKMLRQLLDYSAFIGEGTKPNVESFAPQILFDELLLVFAALAKPGDWKLEARCDPNLGMISSDKLKIKQIVSNLFSNALKYGKKEEDAEGLLIFAFESVDQDRWRITMSDNGIGVAKDELEQIFHEFHRVSSTACIDGSGLGLWITKSLVDALGGYITAESELGQGTRFEIILPRTFYNSRNVE